MSDGVTTHQEGRAVYRVAPGDTWEIVDIDVPSPVRRKGLGRKLVDNILGLALTAGAKTVYAITRADNLVAQQFWESLRFYGSPLRRFYDPDGDCMDAILYSRSPKGPV